MKWIDDLPEFNKRRALHYMKMREDTLRYWSDGDIPKDLAQSVISKCNREIERIAEAKK